MMLRSHNLLIHATRSLAMATFSEKEFSLNFLLSFFLVMATEVARKGLVLGFFEGEAEGEVHLTKTAKQFQDEKKKCLLDLLQISGLAAKKGKCNLFVGLDSEYNNVVLTSLGKKGVGVNELEEIDEGKDNVRTGVAAGVKLLHDVGVKTIAVDPCNEPEAAAEGAFLSVWAYDELKSVDKRKPPPELMLAAGNNDVSQCWEKGRILAEGQNLARYLMEGPANKITPTAFAKIATEKLGSLPNVTVIPRDKAWAQSMKMGAFLSVAQGSHEPPVFLEVKYKGAADASAAPLIFVGKGITFDSGGISIKPSENMDYMRADMGGAACTLSAVYTAAKLKLPINLIGLMPLTENMPGGSATKPGDVHTAMNGKTIQIDNTDAEGRLVLSDALCYADTFNPCAVVDLATLTGAMMIAIGASATGVFTNSKTIWEQMHAAGIKTGDRVWRMPLFKYYTKQVTESVLADVNNIGNAGRYGGACTAAAFLKEFTKCDHWMHMDIAGVMMNQSQVPYLPKGMAGRPTRTLVEFISMFKKP